MKVLFEFFKPKRIIAYLFNGGISTGIQFLTLFTAVDILGFKPLISSVFAFIVSLVVGFTLHRFGTFGRRDTELIGTQFAMVAMMAITNLLINTAAMYVLLGLGVYYLLAQVLVTGTIVTWTYVGYNLIFRYRQVVNNQDYNNHAE